MVLLLRLGANATAPRDRAVFDHNMFDPNNVTGSLRIGNYKLIVGGDLGANQASWYGEFTPNGTHPPSLDYVTCFTDAPCVFDVVNDPTEHNDISSLYPNITSMLLDWFNELKQEFHPPQDNPPEDRPGYCASVKAHQGYVAPWRTDPYIPSN